MIILLKKLLRFLKIEKNYVKPVARTQIHALLQGGQKAIINRAVVQFGIDLVEKHKQRFLWPLCLTRNNGIETMEKIASIEQLSDVKIQPLNGCLFGEAFHQVTLARSRFVYQKHTRLMTVGLALKIANDVQQILDYSALLWNTRHVVAYVGHRPPKLEYLTVV